MKWTKKTLYDKLSNTTLKNNLEQKIYQKMSVTNHIYTSTYAWLVRSEFTWRIQGRGRGRVGIAFEFSVRWSPRLGGIASNSDNKMHIL